MSSKPLLEVKECFKLGLPNDELQRRLMVDKGLPLGIVIGLFSFCKNEEYLLILSFVIVASIRESNCNWWA